PVNICMGSTMDNQLIRELFGNTIQAAKILDLDEDFAKQLADASAQLPPNRIGSDGRLMEWLEEYEEQDPHHRHTSHLYGLHPGNQITPEGTPELADAARKSLVARGDGGTGWSRAWKINFWARLHDGNHAFTLLKNLLEPVYDVDFNYSNKGGTYPNLFCAHPPFQMDGNWGGCAGIAEMFLQSHAGYIHLIPALPDQFNSGSFTGLRARGGMIVSAEWTDKKLKKALFVAENNGKFSIRIPDDVSDFQTMLNGKPLEAARDGKLITVSMKKADKLELTVL
ncbi:MAG TPA: glycoside hydrolase family 95 protein, partial [Prolixibacteraceae bacterium]|nr:glycoside hydrolase family 95 protein [Prolixibacteraceae bacterium]